MHGRAIWWTVTVAVNGVIAASGMGAVEASLVNFCIAIAARHDALVRGVFALGRSVRSYELHQLTYHLGQLHRATAIAGTVWFALALTSVLGLAVLAILLAMAVTASDVVRHRRHNLFEAVHRYGGWTALALLFVLIARQPTPASVVLLGVLIAFVIHPWLGVRRLPAEFLTVTDQLVVVALPGRRAPGEFVRVSRDGREWHCFAVATTGDEGPGRYCLVIRRAGDWTEELAQRRPAQLFVRRVRGRGFMYHARAYERLLVIATGAGIGPVLPYLLEPAGARLECLWVGRDHRRAVGRELVERVLAGGTVTLVDTASGRPDIGALVAERAARYEAVFVVSNRQVRDEVARVCRRLGVRWYGPTFDS
jgi:predicted ferric reductase